MTVSKNKTDGTWHYSVYVSNNAGNKVRKRGYGYATKKEAQAKEDEVVKQYEIYSIARNNSGDLTIQNLFDLYMEYSTNSLSANTKKNYNCGFLKLKDFFGASKKCLDIDISSVQQYRIYLEKTLNTKSSVQLYMAIPKILFNFGLDYGYVASNPFQSKQIKESKTLANPTKEVWSKEDYTIFLNSLDRSIHKEYRLYMLVMLLYNTGLRPSEALSLTWDKIQGNYIYVDRQAEKHGRQVIFVPLKTESSKRKIYISDSVVSELNQYKSYNRSRYIGFNDQWFVLYKNTPMKYSNISTLFKNKQKNLDIPMITLHCLRHSHASLLLKNGVDIAYISKRLGHANISMTLNVYSHYIESKDNFDDLKMADILRL